MLLNLWEVSWMERLLIFFLSKMEDWNFCSAKVITFYIMQPLNWYCFGDIHALTWRRFARPLTYVTGTGSSQLPHSRSHSPIASGRTSNAGAATSRACVGPRPRNTSSFTRHDPIRRYVPSHAHRTSTCCDLWRQPGNICFQIFLELLLALRPCSLLHPTQNISSSIHQINFFDACMEH
jgi:hypothetical protein